MARAVICIRETTNAYKGLVGKLRWKKPFGRPWHRSESKIKKGF
jgi:hypothetical protein